MTENQGLVVWFTGLPSSGKSTLAAALAQRLQVEGKQVEQLDGDLVRSVFPERGFSRVDRDYHIRALGFTAARVSAHGVIVLASFVSPYRDARDFNRALAEKFIEVYVATPIEECERRDVKGLYRRARAGEIKNMTGIDDPYEPPLQAEVTIDTSRVELEQAVSEIHQCIRTALAN